MVWAFLLAGVFLRVFHYLDNRSLWLDEIYLASSLINKDLSDLLFTELEYEQKAPLGFLLFCKLAVMVFGKSELALRFFPFLCGIASLFLFRKVCSYFLKPYGVAIAMGILALAPPLVYHGVEIKQYSTEVLASITCLYLYTRYHKTKSLSSLTLWGIWGGLVLWFAYASVFVLAGMAIGVTGYHLCRKEWSSMVRNLLPFGIWLVSFAVNYFLFTQKHIDSAWLIHYFKVRSSFMPFPPESLRDLLWPIRKAGNRLIRYPLGLTLNTVVTQNAFLLALFKRAFLAIGCILVGLAWFFRKDRKFLLALVMPYLLAVVASALELYPLYERLTVFLAPLFILIIALGCQQIGAFIKRISPAVAFTIPLLLLMPCFLVSGQQLLQPELFGGYKRAYCRDAFLLINDHYKEGDQVYVYWNMLTPYKFYKTSYNLKFNAIEGSDFRASSADASEYFEKLTSEITGLKDSKRVWLIYCKNRGVKIGEFDHRPAWYFKEVLGGKKLHQKFSEMGYEVDGFETPELRVALFEVSKESPGNYQK